MDEAAVSMAASTHVSVEEYLGTSYKPACEYKDGVLIQKPLPALDHSFIQGRIVALIAAFFRAYVALRELTVPLRDAEWRASSRGELLSAGSAIRSSKELGRLSRMENRMKLQLMDRCALVKLRSSSQE